MSIFLSSHFSSRKPRFRSTWAALGAVVITSVAGVLAAGTAPAQAAEDVLLTYGGIARSLSVEEVTTFAETGEQSSTIRFLLKAAKQDPVVVRKFLTQEVKLSLRLVDRIFYSLPGEYALFELGQYLSTPSHAANIQALRSSLILSVSNDSKISVLEFLQNYPTSQMVVDGRKLSGRAGDMGRLVSLAREKLAGPIAIATDLMEGVLCDCESPSPGTPPQ